MTVHFPRHRNGRPVSELLDGQAVPSSGEPRHRVTTAAIPAPRQPMESREPLDLPAVFSTASLARGRVRSELVRVQTCGNRVRIAARVAGTSFTARRNAMNAINNCSQLVESADLRLATALDHAADAAAEARTAGQVVAQFHGHGGTRVASAPTRTFFLGLQARADSYLEAMQQIAERHIRELTEAIESCDRILDGVDRLVDNVAAAPPAVLRLIRLALPRAERSDWWQELWSLFAECTPEERRVHARSHLLSAPRTIWTSWATARQRRQASGRST